MILHSSLQIVTDGGVVTTASLQLLPMKLHVTSEGLRQPQKGCFQISVLFYDEVPRAFLHFVPFLLFMHLTAPCPISTARTRFAFQQHPCPASIFEQIYPKLYSTSMQFPSEIFRNQRPWPHIMGFLPHPCEVTGIWSRKASLGYPSTARWAKGVCYITLHWSHSRTVFCTACCQQTSGVSALCFCLYSEILKSSGSDPCALLAPTYRGRWAPSISVPNETRSSWKCGVFGERGSAVPRAIYVGGFHRGRELTATGLQRAAPISRCLPSALHPAGRTQRASPGAAGGPRPGPERRSRPLSTVSSLPPRAALLGRAPRFSGKGRAAICPLDTHLRGPDVVVQVRQLQHPAEGRRHHRRAAVKRGSRREGRGCDTVVKARCHTAVK